MSDINKYLKNISIDQKAELQKIRGCVKKLVPESQETISYGIPTIKYKGKNLLHFAAFKDHLSLFPGSEPIKKLQKELKSYKVSKGTIQFDSNHSLPKDLLEKIVIMRKDTIDSNAK